MVHFHLYLQENVKRFQVLTKAPLERGWIRVRDKPDSALRLLVRHQKIGAERKGAGGSRANSVFSSPAARTQSYLNPFL
jgi:hypothetical protein